MAVALGAEELSGKQKQIALNLQLPTCHLQLPHAAHIDR